MIIHSFFSIKTNLESLLLRWGGMEFIPFGVPTEVVVIVENENASRSPGLFSIEVGSYQAADAATDYHEVVFLARFY